MFEYNNLGDCNAGIHVCSIYFIQDQDNPFVIDLFCFSGTMEELVKHGLRALRDTLPNESELTTKV